MESKRSIEHGLTNERKIQFPHDPVEKDGGKKYDLGPPEFETILPPSRNFCIECMQHDVSVGRHVLRRQSEVN